MAGEKPDRPQEGLSRAGALPAAGLLVTLLSSALLFYGVVVEPYAVRLHRVAVPVAGLPKGFEGYRVLHISDLETGEPGFRERRVVLLAAQSRPHLIAITGDLIRKDIRGPRRVRAYQEMTSFLASLSAPAGVWFVQGHGERDGRIERSDLEEALAGAGVRLLWDESVTLERGGDRLTLAGIRLVEDPDGDSWRFQQDGSISLGPQRRTRFLELVGEGASAWTDFEMTGRVRFSKSADSVGVLVYSRLSEGEDRTYMARKSASTPFLAPAARGTAFTGGSMRRRTPLRPRIWHRFRVRVRTDAEHTTLQARSWQDGLAEPDDWDLEYTDSSATRISSGRAGLTARGPGVKEFADLTLLPGRHAEWREPVPGDALVRLVARAPSGPPMILLSHTPDIFLDAARLGVPLVLAGHTQGGQIGLPWLGALFTDTRLGRDYASGLFTRGEASLFVTRGVGTTRIPVRFLCPPEVSLLTLRESMKVAGAAR